MKQVLILAAPHYDVTGPMKAIICGYGRCLGKYYNVTIKKMPYHMLPFQKKRIWNELVSEIHPETVAIIPSCLNICYYLLHLRRWIRKDIQLIAWPGDCAIRAGVSELHEIGKHMEYPGFKWLLKKVARLILYYYKEGKILKSYEKVLVITPTDIEFMKTHYKAIKADLKLMPYSIDVPSDEAGVCRINMQEELRIGFLGQFKPDTVDIFFKRFFNACETEIVREIPQLKIVIAGRNATEEQISMLKKYNFVEYCGEVSELTDFYKSVHMVFTTVPKQSGILTKVVEAFAYGKCVVGYRSNFAPIMGIKEGVDYLGADTTREFIDVFKAVLSGKIDVESVGNSARKAMIQYYRWEVNGDRLKKYIEESEKRQNEQ